MLQLSFAFGGSQNPIPPPQIAAVAEVIITNKRADNNKVSLQKDEYAGREIFVVSLCRTYSSGRQEILKTPWPSIEAAQKEFEIFCDFARDTSW